MIDIDTLRAWVKLHFVRKRDLGVLQSYTPVITSSGVAPDVLTYTAQSGTYVRVGDLVFFSFQIVINAFTLGSGTGNVRVNLPLAARGNQTRCTALAAGVDLPGTPIGLVFTIDAAAAYGYFQAQQDNANNQSVPLSALAAGDVLIASGFYFV